MKLEYRGDRDGFTALLNRHGIYGSWRDLGNQQQYRVTDGAIVNWYQSSKGVMVQGTAEPARAVRVLLEKVLPNRSLAGGPVPQTWSEINFGKYEGEGKTWPEVTMSDPNYLGYLLDGGFRGRMKDEFQYVAERAQRIRIPREHPEEYNVVHEISEGGRYRQFAILPKHVECEVVPEDGASATRIDLLAAYRLAPNDWNGGEKLIASFNRHFGKSRAYQRGRTESELFFENDANFVL